jgi:rhodanese-related sulfurtransferase
MAMLGVHSLAHAEVMDVDNAGLQALLKQDVAVIDVRRPEDQFRRGCVAKTARRRA